MVPLLEVGAVPVVSSRGIFLSYRREDTAPYARLLQIQLHERFPDVPVFMDLDSIEGGLDFAEVIREAVGSCAVLVALIGRQWATIVDERGRRRLDDPDDFVRFEVQLALERGVRVIPVLVDGAKSLRQEQLPVELHKLARLNALELSYGRYEYDADRLLDLIQRVLTGVSSNGIVPESWSTENAEASAVPHDVKDARHDGSPQGALVDGGLTDTTGRSDDRRGGGLMEGPWTKLSALIGIVACLLVYVAMASQLHWPPFTRAATPTPVFTFTPTDLGSTPPSSPAITPFRLMTVGTCVELLPTGWSSRGVKAVVSCIDPHDAELYDIRRAPSGTYPGTTVLSKQVNDWCNGDLSQYEAKAITAHYTIPSGIGHHYIYPTAADWASGDTREYCFFTVPVGQHLTRPLRS